MKSIRSLAYSILIKLLFVHLMFCCTNDKQANMFGTHIDKNEKINDIESLIDKRDKFCKIKDHQKLKTVLSELLVNPSAANRMIRVNSNNYSLARLFLAHPPDILEIFIERGLNPCLRDSSNESIYQTLVSKTYLASHLKLLLERYQYKCKLKVHKSRFQNSMATLAIKNRNLNALKVLLSHFNDALLNAKEKRYLNSKYRTRDCIYLDHIYFGRNFTYIISQDYRDIFCYLLNNYPVINNEIKSHIVNLACYYGSKSIMQYIISKTNINLLSCNEEVLYYLQKTPKKVFECPVLFTLFEEFDEKYNYYRKDKNTVKHGRKMISKYLLEYFDTYVNEEEFSRIVYSNDNKQSLPQDIIKEIRRWTNISESKEESLVYTVEQLNNLFL